MEFIGAIGLFEIEFTDIDLDKFIPNILPDKKEHLSYDLDISSIGGQKKSFQD